MSQNAAQLIDELLDIGATLKIINRSGSIPPKLKADGKVFIAWLETHLGRIQFKAVAATAQEAIDLVLNEFETWADMSRSGREQLDLDYHTHWDRQDRDEWEKEVEWRSVKFPGSIVL